ncbi:MAG: ImmA/IrrE family metallo-endopeptidase [bacterium]|nr:ImmA/IrrE family metallo-endopeptidase [bacterium]
MERAARFARSVILKGVSPTQQFPDVRAFERLDDHYIKASGRPVRLDYAVNPLPPGVEALAVYDEGRDRLLVAVSPETYRGLQAGYPRARFCLCHEIGHACLHGEQLVRLGRIPHQRAVSMLRGKAEHPRYRDTEWQANAFAGALLMPAVGLAELESAGGVLTASRLQRVYGVSAHAAQIRLQVFTQRRRELLAA